MLSLAVPPGSILMSGWVLHDDLGYDSTAQWMHLSTGACGRDDRLGRVAAAALWQLPVLAVITGLALPVAVGLGALMATGAWQWGWALLAGGALWGAGRARCPLHRSRRRMTRR